MTKRINWSKVKSDKSIRTNGAVSRSDEGEFLERDAAARWLRRHDPRMQNVGNSRNQPKQWRGK